MRTRYTRRMFHEETLFLAGSISFAIDAARAAFIFFPSAAADRTLRRIILPFLCGGSPCFTRLLLFHPRHSFSFISATSSFVPFDPSLSLSPSFSRANPDGQERQQPSCALLRN